MTMLEAFEWYVPADHKHWKRLRNAIPDFKEIGIYNLWIRECASYINFLVFYLQNWVVDIKQSYIYEIHILLNTTHNY